jgi:hypothetical protein
MLVVRIWNFFEHWKLCAFFLDSRTRSIETLLSRSIKSSHVTVFFRFEIPVTFKQTDEIPDMACQPIYSDEFGPVFISPAHPGTFHASSKSIRFKCVMKSVEYYNS